ncbi:MAG: F0F1 ATP synthase subunit B [Chloroflexi bacterium]|nr:F0F1 ATP synthase subunit B [Chloroflexota bacterium]
MQLGFLVNSILAAEATDSSIPAQLGISLGNLIFQALGFAILMFVLWRFAYKPLLRILDERRDRAQEIVEKSDQIKKDLSETEARTRGELEKARTEAQAIIAEARATRDRIVGDARDAAAAAAAAENERARAELAREREQAVAQLRRETADLAIAAATRVIGRELSTNKDLQVQLINDVLSQANSNQAGDSRMS